MLEEIHGVSKKQNQMASAAGWLLCVPRVEAKAVSRPLAKDPPRHSKQWE